LKINIPLITTLGIESFEDGVIASPISCVTNGIIAKRLAGKHYVTQRPSINIVKKKPDGLVGRGRGIFYWGLLRTVCFVNDNKLYHTDYAYEINEQFQNIRSIVDIAGRTIVTTRKAHGYRDKDRITIANSQYHNHEVTISRLDSFRFTYPNSSVKVENSSYISKTTITRGLGRKGIMRVYFFEVGDYLVILDSENNAAWYVYRYSPTTLVEITDSNFPGHNSPYTLVKGGAVLNGTLYVMDTTGSIFGSEIGDPATWKPLNFITAEAESDSGIMLTKHNNHVVAFGNCTTEFFYDAANLTGSSLTVRQDLMYEFGIVDFDTVWTDQNVLFFIAQLNTGGITVKMMSDMEIRDISTGDIDTFLTATIQEDRKSLIGSGFSIGQTMFYILTIYDINNDIAPLESIVYNSATNTWTIFKTGADINSKCALMDWVTPTTIAAKGILSNGNLISIEDNYHPVDIAEGKVAVYATAVYANSVFTTEEEGAETNIPMEIITGPNNNNTANRKFMSSLRVLTSQTSESQNLNISWSDEDNNSWIIPAKPIDTSLSGQRITRLGSYRQRNFKLAFAGNEQIEINALEAELAIGSY